MGFLAIIITVFVGLSVLFLVSFLCALCYTHPEDQQ